MSYSELYDTDQVRHVDRSWRSSSFAYIFFDDPVVNCVGNRALKFMGLVEHEAFETLQIVR